MTAKNTYRQWILTQIDCLRSVKAVFATPRLALSIIENTSDQRALIGKTASTHPKPVFSQGVL